MSHVDLVCNVGVQNVISGDVERCAILGGSLVGLLLKLRMFSVCSWSIMSAPLVSLLWVVSHVVWCALKSPPKKRFGRVVMF